MHDTSSVELSMQNTTSKPSIHLLISGPFGRRVIILILFVRSVGEVVLCDHVQRNIHSRRDAGALTAGCEPYPGSVVLNVSQRLVQHLNHSPGVVQSEAHGRHHYHHVLVQPVIGDDDFVLLHSDRYSEKDWIYFLSMCCRPRSIRRHLNVTFCSAGWVLSLHQLEISSLEYKTNQNING